MNDRPRLPVGTWVSLVATGMLSGVVVEDAGSGMLVVQVVVGEWMVDSSEPLALEEECETGRG